jgi:homoserine O-succinyltransferase
MGSHESRNAPPGHLERFYVDSGDAIKRRFDGLIITGAPVETLPFEEVDYWDELCAVMDWSRSGVFSTMHICWGAQAGLYHHYGIPKVTLKEKLFGVFPHAVNERSDPLFRGFDDEFMAPQSRHTSVDRQAIAARPELKVQSEAEAAGVFIMTSRAAREIYVTGHLEYDPLTLDAEYRRDAAKGAALNPPVAVSPPLNYYPFDDPSKPPVVRWRAHAHLFIRNWLNYVYQETPYDLARLEE